MSAGLPRRRFRAAAALALLPLLAGCGGLLPEPPARQLYRAIPAFAFPAGLPRIPTQLLVAMPRRSGPTACRSWCATR